MPELTFLYPEPFSAIEPRWANAEHTKIDCNIIFPHIGPDPIRYTASQSDPGWEHSEAIFETLAGGTLGVPVAAYIPPSLPVPTSISDRQFAHELRAREIITQLEAVAFVARGEIPSALAALVAALPSQRERDDAELLIAGATVFERAHPLTQSIASGFGWTSEDTDDFFRDAAAR